MNNYQFAYGDGTVTLPLEGCNILGELHGNKVEPIKDIRAALWESLDEPIGSEALCNRVKAGDTVALIVSDMSRFWMRQDLVVPHLVDKIYQVDIPEKADVIVTSCGSFPKDISLYQGTKAIDNVESGLNPGGTLILIIEARDGGGPAEYFDWSKDLTAGTIEQRLREHFTVAGYIFFLNCEQAQRYNILLYSSIDPKDVEPMGMKAFSDVDSLLAAAQLEGKSVYVIPNGSTVIPHVKEDTEA